MKQLRNFVLVLSIVVLLVGTAAVPFAPRNLTLIGAEYLPGKGFAFTFAVSGAFEPGELKNAKLVIGSQSFDIGCELLENGNLRCIASGLAAYEGRNARIELAGLLFYTVIPGKVEPAGPVWAECPDDASETVHITSSDQNAQVYNGSFGYFPASARTIDEAVLELISIIESLFSVTIVSYEITNVTCTY